MDIKQALASLDHGNDAHWTTDGQPRIDALEAIMGTKGVKRQDVVEVAPHFNRYAAADAAGAAIEDPDEDYGDRPQATVDGSTEVTEDARARARFAASLNRALAEWSTPEIVRDHAEALGERERELLAARARVDAELVRVREERDRFARRAEQLDSSTPNQRHHRTTGAYLATQQEALVRRAAARAQIREAGIDLSKVAELVQGARIDQVMKRRTGLGGQRPAPALPPHLTAAS